MEQKALFYVMGGGMGHLRRVSVFIGQMGIRNYKVVSNSKYATLVFDSKHLLHLSINMVPKEVAALVGRFLESGAYQSLYIDTFPAGTMGELCKLYDSNLKNVKFYLLARDLIWSKYKSKVSENIFFERAYTVESLSPSYKDWLLLHTKVIEETCLVYPQPKPKKLRHKLEALPKPLWLIAHSGSLVEVDVLREEAKDVADSLNAKPFVVICRPREAAPIDLMENETVSYHFPARDFFPIVDKIFTAAGFNSMAETKDFKEKHHFIPFPRKYDDQFKRAAARRESKFCK